MATSKKYCISFINKLLLLLLSDIPLSCFRLKFPVHQGIFAIYLNYINLAVRYLLNSYCSLSNLNPNLTPIKKNTVCLSLSGLSSGRIPFSHKICSCSSKIGPFQASSNPLRIPFFYYIIQCVSHSPKFPRHKLVSEPMLPF